MDSLRNNPIARSTLLFDIISAIKENKKSNKRLIGKSFNSKGLDWNKRELDYVVAWALENNYLAETPNHELRLGEAKAKSPKQDFKLVLTIPPYTELGLKNIAHRNQMMTTQEAFITLIKGAKEQIRITSPFVNSNLNRRNAIPEFKRAISESLARGCVIKLITRISGSHPISTVQWLIDFVQEQGFGPQLKIKYFHFDEDDYDHPTIITSIHSKIIISDDHSAYVGSAELKESKNFEVGCFFEGNNVPSLIESFDLMFHNSKEL